MSAVLADRLPGRIGLVRDRGDRLMAGLIAVYVLFFLACVVVPMAVLVRRSFVDVNGQWLGLSLYRGYLASDAFLTAFLSSTGVAALTSAIVVPLAFGYAWALSRSCMVGKTFFRAAVYVPLLIPGILKAIALIYLFGNQGLLKSWLPAGTSIYGAVGVVASSVMWTFPHAVLILMVSLLNADRRLYQAAEMLQAGPWRTFLHVTWPGCRYGVITAFLSVFVMVFTDFGIAKVIGGKLELLATDIYKEVVGLQNFGMGAVVSVVLLVPAVLVFMVERVVAARQSIQFTGRSQPLHLEPRPVRDGVALVYCAFLTLLMAGVLGMAQFAALVKFWPYNLELTLGNYRFDMEGMGWINFWNSLRMAALTASLGTAVVFVGAYLVEKPRFDAPWRKLLQALMLAPMAIPGLVLGLAYLIIVNQPGSVLGGLYGGMAILVLSSLVHLYSVPHVTALTALKSLGREIEQVALSLKVPVWRSFLRVTVVACAPALLDIWLYFFLRAMTTLSAIIFLYATQTKTAAIAVIHVDETGATASAAAMAMLVVYACLLVRLAHHWASGRLLARTQAWRGRA